MRASRPAGIEVFHEFIFFALLVASFIDDHSRPDDWAELPHLLSTPSDQAHVFYLFNHIARRLLYSYEKIQNQIRCNYRISYM
jgi:hypothetical protein